MSYEHLLRDDAPFGPSVWEAIDNTAVGAARGQLTARRLLRIQGPYGLGLKNLPTSDSAVAGNVVGGVTLSASAARPVALVQSEFSLAARDIAAYEQTCLPMDLAAVAAAAIACARQEDELIFNGIKDLGVEGLLTSKKASSSKLSQWTEVGVAAEDVIKAATALDAAGFHGPYALALEPGLYNRLLRLYPGTSDTELSHVEQIASAGIIKSAAIAKGGLLMASGDHVATIVIGQDLMVGFVGPEGGKYVFSLTETLALDLKTPQAVCILK